MSDVVLLERSEGVLTVTLNRPEALNALTVDGMAALAADGRRVAVAGVSMGALLALHLAVGRPEVAALVLAGTCLLYTSDAADE